MTDKKVNIPQPPRPPVGGTDSKKGSYTAPTENHNRPPPPKK